MAYRYTPRQYVRPAKINKDFVQTTNDTSPPKPVRLCCWKCKRKTPHTNGKCNWCGSDHEEELS